jgi:hypothetical protein
LSAELVSPDILECRQWEALLSFGGLVPMTVQAELPPDS